MNTQEAVDFANECRGELQKLLPEHFELIRFVVIPSRPYVVYGAIDCRKQLSGLSEHCMIPVEHHMEEIGGLSLGDHIDFLTSLVMDASKSLSEFIEMSKESHDATTDH